MPTRTLTTCLLLAAAAAAQTETSPKGYLTTEAGGQHGNLLGYSSYHAFAVQIDGTLAGSGGRSIKRLHLRRDGALPANADYVARTLGIEVRVAHGDWSKVTSANSVQVAGLLKGSWTTAFTLKSVSLPALTAAPATQPAPWAITLTLDAPFSFNGTDALALGLRADPSAASQGKQYPIDLVQQTAYAPGATTKLGTGCIPTGLSNPMFHSHLLWNYGFDGSWGYAQLTTGGAKPNVPVFVLLGTGNPDVAFGGCERLLTSGEVVLSSGPTNASGYFNLSFAFAQKPSFAGVQLYSQSAMLDAGQPLGVALSNGVRATYPQPPSGLLQCALAQYNSQGTTWPAAMTFYKGSGLVFGLGS